MKPSFFQAVVMSILLYGRWLNGWRKSLMANTQECCKQFWTSPWGLMAPSHGQAKAGWPAQTYIQQLCEDTGCSPKDLPEAISDREGWREWVRDIHAGDTTRWWWWWWMKQIITDSASSALLFFLYFLSCHVWLSTSISRQWWSHKRLSPVNLHLFSSP